MSSSSQARYCAILDLLPPGRVGVFLPEAETFTDRELLHGLARGGPGGFAAFYDRFACVLLSVTWCILRDLKDAEQALEEAFVQMWNQASTFDPARGNSLFSWALLTARSRALDRLRQRQSVHQRAQLAAARAFGQQFEFESDPAENPTQRADRERAMAALILLSPHQLEALELAFFAAMTDTEISSTLRISLATVKARIRDGLIALRKSLPPRSQEGRSKPTRYAYPSHPASGRKPDHYETALC